MKTMKKLNRRYEISSYPGQGTEFPTKECGVDEKNKVVYQDYVHVIDESRGIYGYRSATGEWIERPLRGSGLGPVGLDIIEALQCNPGEALGPSEISSLTGYESLLDSNCYAVRMVKIRAAHQETPEAPVFFFTVGDGYMWPTGISWLRIRRIKDADVNQHTEVAAKQ